MRPEGVLLDRHAFSSTVHSKAVHSLCRTGLCGPSKIFRVFVVKSGFPGLLVSAEPRKMRAVLQKLRRVWWHILFCALADGLWMRHFCTLLLNNVVMTWPFMLI
jgi:hypothetical protein